MTADWLFMAYSHCWLLCRSQGVVAALGTKVPGGLLDNMLTGHSPDGIFWCCTLFDRLWHCCSFQTLTRMRWFVLVNQYGWLRDFKLGGFEGWTQSSKRFRRKHRAKRLHQKEITVHMIDQVCVVMHDLDLWLCNKRYGDTVQIGDCEWTAFLASSSRTGFTCFAHPVHPIRLAVASTLLFSAFFSILFWSPFFIFPFSKMWKFESVGLMNWART